MDGLVHVDYVGGDVSVIEEASLLGPAELVGEGGKDAVEERGYDAVVCVDD